MPVLLTKDQEKFLIDLDDYLTGDLANNLSLNFKGEPHERSILESLDALGLSICEAQGASGHFWFKLTPDGVKNAMALACKHDDEVQAGLIKCTNNGSVTR